MADSSRRATPRTGTPRGGAARPQRAPKPSRAPKQRGTSKLKVSKASRAPKAARAPRRAEKASSRLRAPKAAVPKAPASARASRPAFLDNARKAATGVSAPRAQREQRPQTGREARQRHQRGQSMKVVLIVLAVVAVLGAAAGIAYLVLRDSSVFSIDQVTCEATSHVSDDDIQKLLKVDEGSTLLNFDRDKVEASLKKNPWVSSVSFTLEFPHTLKCTINEQNTDCLVVMSSGSIGWYLGSDNCWIEPCKISVEDGQSVNDAALAKATQEGVLLITGVPSTCTPQAGSEATDEVISAVNSFRQGFSSSFSSQIVSYDASSSDAISCILSSGVEISLGSASNISYKEQIAESLLEKYPGQLTYINVRVPSSATMRKISSTDTTAGTGAVGSSVTSATSSTTSSTASTAASDDSSSNSSDAAGESTDEYTGEESQDE
jgi:cell division protein FtsQ